MSTEKNNPANGAEIIDLEAYTRSDKQVPVGKRYKVKVDGEDFVFNDPVVTGQEVLEKAGKIPVEFFDLYLKIKGRENEQIGLKQKVNLAQGGVEHFITKEVKAQVVLIVNGREKPWDQRTITFQQVVKLATGSYEENNRTYYTVTYDKGPRENPEGTMVKGDRVFVKNKMIFNVTATDKS